MANPQNGKHAAAAAAQRTAVMTNAEDGGYDQCFRNCLFYKQQKLFRAVY
jgi:hypothetical protein